MRILGRPWGVSVAALIVVCGLVPVGAAAQTSDRARALALFDESVAHYRAGRFERASELLREAYELEPEPVLQYNLARALEGAGLDVEAVEAYELYLSTEDEADAAAARSRLEVLRRRISDREELEARVRTAAQQGMEIAPQSPTPAAEVDATPWIIAGAGGLLLIGGAALGGAMLDRSDAATNAATHAEAAGAVADAEALAVAANAMFGVGSLIASLGLIWGLVILNTDASEPSARIEIGPRSLSLVVEVP